MLTLVLVLLVFTGATGREEDELLIQSAQPSDVLVLKLILELVPRSLCWGD